MLRLLISTLLLLGSFSLPQLASAAEQHADLVIDQPPGVGWELYEDRPLDRSYFIDSGEPIPPGMPDEPIGWVRAWLREETGQVVVITLADGDTLAGAQEFVDGAFTSLEPGQQLLPPPEGLEGVKRLRGTAEAVEYELWGFAKGRYGVQAIAFGLSSEQLLPQIHELQMQHLPDEPAATKEDFASAGLGASLVFSLLLGALIGYGLNGVTRRRLVNPWAVGTALVLVFGVLNTTLGVLAAVGAGHRFLASSLIGSGVGAMFIPALGGVLGMKLYDRRQSASEGIPAPTDPRPAEAPIRAPSDHVLGTRGNDERIAPADPWG